MPTYEYLCTSCQHRFEEFQSIVDPPLSRCPKCGKKIKRLIGGGMGVIFKGSGFYTTDYKRSSASTGAGSGSSSKTDEKKSDSGTTGSKSSPSGSSD
jgi:putative FmdB family regulatory protein